MKNNKEDVQMLKHLEKYLECFIASQMWIWKKFEVYFLLNRMLPDVFKIYLQSEWERRYTNTATFFRCIYSKTNPKNDEFLERCLELLSKEKWRPKTNDLYFLDKLDLTDLYFLDKLDLTEIDDYFDSDDIFRSYCEPNQILN